MTEGTSKYPANLNRGEGQKKVMTNVRLTLAFGNSSQSMRLTPISNSKPTEAEFNMYKNHLKSKRIRFPTARDITRQAKKTRKILDNFVRTDEDVEREIKLNKQINPEASITNLALEVERAKVVVTDTKETLALVSSAYDKLVNAHPDKTFIVSKELMDDFDEDDDEPDDPLEQSARSIVRAAKEKRTAEEKVRMD